MLQVWFHGGLISSFLASVISLCCQISLLPQQLNNSTTQQRYATMDDLDFILDSTDIDHGLEELDKEDVRDCMARIAAAATHGMDTRDSGDEPSVWDKEMTKRQEQVMLLLSVVELGNVALFKRNLPLYVKDGLINEKDVHYGLTALISASMHGHVGMVQLLLERNATVDLLDSIGRTALMGSACGGHLMITNMLLDRGANPNLQDNQGATALIHSAHQGYKDVSKLLLEHHAKINLPDSNGRSALMAAAHQNHIDVIKLLLKNGAAVDKEALSGGTALMITAFKGYTKAARALLQYNASTNIIDEEGNAALMLASKTGRVDVVQLLLGHHAIVDKQNRKKWTALMTAAQNNHIDVVGLLLKQHANTKLQNNKGKTALMLAIKKESFGTVRVLVEHSDDASLASYFTQYSAQPTILKMIKQVQNWRRRKHWVMTWSALHKAVALEEFGTLTLREEVLAFDWVGRKVASFL